MFGLMRQIRNKSDSDFAEHERQLNNELSHIARLDRQTNLNTRRTVRAQREAQLTSDSDGENARYLSHMNNNNNDNITSPVPTSGPLGGPEQQEHYNQRQRMKRHYQPKLPMYSDEEKEKEFKMMDKMVDSQDMRPCFPFSVLSTDKSIVNGTEVIQTRTRKNREEVRLAQLQKDNRSIELLSSSHTVVTKAKSISNLTTSELNTINDKTNKGLSPMRLRMAVFKQRLRTDKALFKHFSTKIIKQRRKIFEQNEDKKRVILEEQLRQFYQNKIELMEQLDNTPLSVLLNGGPEGNNNNTNGTNPDGNTPSTPIGFSTDLEDVIEGHEHEEVDENNNNTQQQQYPEITEEDILNVVTRVDLESIIDPSTLIEQGECYYCTHRPLHTFSTTSQQPLQFTTESGLAHWNLIPTKWKGEILKGGRFISDIERILLAISFGYPLLPYGSNYLQTVNGDNSCNEKNRAQALNTLMDIQSYTKFITKQRLPTQSHYQTPLAPLSSLSSPSPQTPDNNQQDNTQPFQQIVVQLDTNWFGLCPRDPIKGNSYQPSDILTIENQTFIPTHHGVTLFVKDLYALNLVTALAAFHSCYITTHQLKPITTSGGHTNTSSTTTSEDNSDKLKNDIQKYIYQIEIYFNTGCCLCNKEGELDKIHNTGLNPQQYYAQQQQQQQQGMNNKKKQEDKNDDPGDTTTSSLINNDNADDAYITASKVIKNDHLDSIDITSDEAIEEGLVVGLLKDSSGIQIEQYTYCIPHLKTISDIELLLEQQQQQDDGN